jgi:DNA-binding transcriptional LysR family regulator
LRSIDVNVVNQGSFAAVARERNVDPSSVSRAITALEEELGIRLLQDYDVTATDFSTAAWLVYPSRAYVPLKVRVFIDFLKQFLRPTH